MWSLKSATVFALLGARLLASRLPIDELMSWLSVQKRREPMDARVDEFALAELRAILESASTDRHFTCLHRSIAGWFVLRSLGHRPKLLIGVRPADSTHETSVHAWMELPDESILILYRPDYRPIMEFS